MSEPIVIVGGVAAGASAATRARRLNEDVPILIYEKSGYVSFANCGLPYHVGGVIQDRNALLMQSPEQFKQRFNIDVMTHHEVLQIDRQAKRVQVKNLTNGETHLQAYAQLILTTGAQPFVPPIENIDAPNVHLLRTIEDMDRVRTYIQDHAIARVAILGAGFIGLESAEVFDGLGLRVDVIELADQVLPPLDADMARYVAAHLKEHSVAVHLGQPASRFILKQGTVTEVELADGHQIPTDLVLLGVGVRPNSELAAQAGLELGARGHIKVDEHMKTSDPFIYAAGDVTEVTSILNHEPVAIPLAGPANKHGRLAGQVAATGQGPAAAAVAGTAIVQVFDLQVASTGYSMKAARAAGVQAEFVLVRRPHHVSYYPDAQPMVIKLIYENTTRRLLGAQMVGRAGVEARVDVIATVLHFGGTIDDLAQLDLAYAPQFGAAKDPLHIAAFVAQNQEDSRVRHIDPQQLQALESADLQLVDVRSPAEYEQGTIPNAQNLELPELRKRLQELDSQKPVVVYCQTGQRSYNAARILMQRGFSDVVSLAGGMSHYRVQSDDSKG